MTYYQGEGGAPNGAYRSQHGTANIPIYSKNFFRKIYAENEIFLAGDGSFSIDEMLNQNSIVNLSSLPTPEIMKSVARFVLLSVYNTMLAQDPSKEIKLYVVIDEAHKLSYDQTLTDLIRVC
jgi:hypothetical protein